jgi:hypothetical protein
VNLPCWKSRAGVGVLGFWRALSPAERMNCRRARFLADRKPESDKLFLRAAGITDPAMQVLAIFIRRQIARACSVPRQMLHHDDTLDDLIDIMDWGCRSWLCNPDWATWNVSEFDLALTDSIRRRIGLDYERFAGVRHLASLPPFGTRGRPLCWVIHHRGKANTVPHRLDEWVREAAMVYLRYTPPEWVKRLTEIGAAIC